MVDDFSYIAFVIGLVSASVSGRPILAIFNGIGIGQTCYTSMYIPILLFVHY